METKTTEPTLEELKIKNTVEEINKLLKENNLVLYPLLKFSERGVFPAIDLRTAEPNEVKVEKVEEVKEKENDEAKS